MKKLTLIGCVIAAVAFAMPAHAGAPLDGTYKSTDLPGGTIPMGRYSESWTVLNGYLMVGNTQRAESWDGLALSTVWRYECGSIAAPPVLVISTVDANGNGNETWMKQYTGGRFFLSGTGPWENLASPEPSYTGVIDTYAEFETIQFSNFVRVGAVSNVQATARFDNFNAACLNFAVGNLAWISDTGIGPQPPMYPPFLQQSTCTPTLTMGSSFDVSAVTLIIESCVVPVEESTWGNIKALYE